MVPFLVAAADLEVRTLIIGLIVAFIVALIVGLIVHFLHPAYERTAAAVAFLIVLLLYVLQALD